MQHLQRLLTDLAMVAGAMDAIARVRHLRAELADDWKQSAWVMLLEREAVLMTQFRGESSSRTFLGTVLDRHCLDWLGRENRSWLTRARRRPEESARAERRGAHAFLDPLIASEERVDHDHLLACIRLAIEHLGATDHDIVFQYVVERKKMRDVATVVGCSTAAAHQRVHRALIRLRKLLESNPPARPPARPPQP